MTFLGVFQGNIQDLNSFPQIIELKKKKNS